MSSSTRLGDVVDEGAWWSAESVVECDCCGECGIFHKSPKCECGYDIFHIRTQGKLGCAKCYEAFREEIVQVLPMLQGGKSSHLGKRPKFGDLALAIREERYEDAAIILKQRRADEKFF